MEGAAGGRRERVRHLAGDRRALAGRSSRGPARRRAACACTGAAAARTGPARPRARPGGPRYMTPMRVGDVRHHGEVVRDEQVGQPEPRLQVAHQVEDLRLHRDVERRRRLVADQELRRGRKGRARSRCAGAGRRRTRAGYLSPSSGARPTCVSSSATRSCDAVPVASEAQDHGSARRRCRARASAGSGWRRDPGRSSACAGAGARSRRAPQDSDLHAVEGDAAARRRVQADDQARERGLAAAGFADQRERLALAHLERDVVHRAQQLPRRALRSRGSATAARRRSPARSGRARAGAATPALR